MKLLLVLDDDVTQEDLLQQLEQNLTDEEEDDEDDDSSTLSPASKGSNAGLGVRTPRRDTTSKLLPSDCKYGILRKINGGPNNQSELPSKQDQASFEGGCVNHKKLYAKSIPDDADSLRQVLKRKLKPESKSSSCTDLLNGVSCLCKSASDYSFQSSKNKNIKLSTSLVCLQSKKNNGQSLEKFQPSFSTKQNKRKQDPLNTGSVKKSRRGSEPACIKEAGECSVGGQDKLVSASGDCDLYDPNEPTSLVEEKDGPIIPIQLFDSTDTSVDKQELAVYTSPSRNVICQPSLDIPDFLYVAIDCEMVGTGLNGRHSVLARCSVVDYNGKVLYDQYIRPEETITDYRTIWSGIRPSHMKTAVPIQQALPDIKRMLENKVIIGHAVYHDFKVLGWVPPYFMVRDTSTCKLLVEMASLQGRGNSLKKLSGALLDRHIQKNRKGHCSVEDSRATLDLFKLVRHEWEKELVAKWLKKDENIVGLINSMVESAVSKGAVNLTEDFLHDKFWPDQIE
ncbi:uncharacterized protein LOC131943286 [Physella acuta]|uniref:uncharacterized protein LOC131943286 n=1 Tax=Physella acuta TaxID=109671 RepID=UPI0027DD4F13|nr:uncharacterized protein LOC131943286 [Physella acuta]